jgi:predicted DNA-binding transcriptional regulator AlpA
VLYLPEGETLESEAQHMSPEELKAAEEQLAQRPEYDWLTRDPARAWFNVSEVARGAGVARPTVYDWCKDGRIPGAIDYGDSVGWKIPRSGLIEFFTSLQRRQNQAG